MVCRELDGIIVVDTDKMALSMIWFADMAAYLPVGLSLIFESSLLHGNDKLEIPLLIFPIADSKHG